MANGLESLADFLKSRTPGEFKAELIYEPHTDSLIYYVRNIRSYSKRINNLLTLFLSQDDDSLVGCEVKGIQWLRSIVKSYFGVVVSDSRFTLGIFLGFALAEKPSDPEFEDRYKEELDSYKDVEINEEELEPAGC